jgi:hypothetical protein
MSKIDVVQIASQKGWVDLGSKNIKELTACNNSTVGTTIDFAIGPNTLINTSGDTGCVYFVKDLKLPVGTTLIFDEEWILNTFSAGMTIYNNSVTAGVLTRTIISNPRFLVRTGDNNVEEAADLIILRK